jgi:hypothetical protein
MWRGNQDAGGMRPPSKKRNFQGAIHQIEGEEEQGGDNFQVDLIIERNHHSS